MIRTRNRARRAIGICCVVVLAAGCGSAVPPGQFVDVAGFGHAGASPPGTAGPGGQQPQGIGGVATTAATAPSAPRPAGSPSPQGRGGAAAAPAGNAGPGPAQPPAAGGSPAPGGPAAGSCAGFTNGTGISDSTIKIANASDLSGPIPGLFRSAQQAAAAYVAYFNATSSICGRKLKLLGLDSGTSSSGDQQAATAACSDSFAMVGSMSAFDDGGASTVTKCGIPDLRAIFVNPSRAAAPVSFGTDSIAIRQIPSAPFDYIKSIGDGAHEHAAMLYLTAGAAVTNAESFRKAEEKMGYRFVYTQAVDVTTFNYSPFVASMQSKGVKLVQWLGTYQNAVRLKLAMDQQGFRPIFLMDSVAYDPAFVKSGGSAVEGTYAFVDTALFEEKASNRQMQTYLTWLQRVSPGATPSFFGIFAWGAMKLFTELAVQLGGRLNRQSLIRAIKGVHDYTANGLFSKQDVGGKTTSPCQTVIQLQDGVWKRRTPAPYACGRLVDSGVG